MLTEHRRSVHAAGLRSAEQLAAMRKRLIYGAPVLVALGMAAAPARAFAVVVIASVGLSVAAARLRRGAAAIVALTVGVLGVGGGLIARDWPITLAGLAFLVVGGASGWGVNRGLRRRRQWRNRALGGLLGLGVSLFVIYPTLLAVDYLAKPGRPIDESSLGLAHRDVSFRASDGIRLSGWYVPSRNGAAIVLVHGGGGDRTGTVRHARMLAHAGYGVLLYDARGRGRSSGRENAAGWRWDRDVRGAVDYLGRHGVRRIGAMGLSTGAEAVVAEAAYDARVRAVVADGVQGRTPADARHLHTGDRALLEPVLAVANAEIGAVSGEHQPQPLDGLVRRVAATRPLLLIATVPLERNLDEAYTHGTSAQLWELPRVGHTGGLLSRPAAYQRHVLRLLGTALG
jgi:hypothetical protein